MASEDALRALCVNGSLSLASQVASVVAPGPTALHVRKKVTIASVMAITSASGALPPSTVSPLGHFSRLPPALMGLDPLRVASDGCKILVIKFF